MLFLLDYEEEFDFITKDSLIVKQVIDNTQGVHSYKIMCCHDFYAEDLVALKDKEDFPTEYIDAIPVGSIQFTEAYLKIFHNIEHEPPIEIPKALQEVDFLKRKYFECGFDSLPKTGNFFVKDISHQKQFTFIGNIENITDAIDFDPAHKFQVSEILDILSEYRIYVINGEIVNIVRYKGDVTVFPKVEFIKNVINKYSTIKEHYNSYSFDIMITTRGEALIEIHSFLSLGLYSNCWDNKLLLGYIEGINKLKSKNQFF